MNRAYDFRLDFGGPFWVSSEAHPLFGVELLDQIGKMGSVRCRESEAHHRRLSSRNAKRPQARGQELHFFALRFGN
jgi:hypothetical protein